jgi:hypothetical protein
LKEHHRHLHPDAGKGNFVFPPDNRSFRCQKCAQLFLAQDFFNGGILEHLRLAHGRVSTPQPPQNPGEDKLLSDEQVVVLQCRNCDGIFREQSFLVEHRKFCSAK